jgi:Fe-S oxidoreductase
MFGFSGQIQKGVPMGIDKSLLPEKIFEQYSTDLYHCASCNYCVDAVWPERNINHVCVTMQHHEKNLSYSGRGFIEAARFLAEGNELDLSSLARRVFTCTGCGNCDTACPIDLRPSGVGEALKGWLSKEGLAPREALVSIRKILSDGRALSGPGINADLKYTKHAEVDCEINYFSGCASNELFIQTVRSDLQLMDLLGVKFRYLEPHENCCGAALSELGEEKESAIWAQELFKGDVGSLGNNLVISGYECCSHLSKTTDKEPVPFPRWVLPKLLSKSHDTKVHLRAKGSLRVNLLETCQLKKNNQTMGSNSSDEFLFRTFLEEFDIVVLNKHYPSRHALCCGASGSMQVMQPASSEAMAIGKLPIEEDVVSITLDPRCALHYCKSAKSSNAVMSFSAFICEYFAISD